ncbi:MAG: right-handed parallel beta-helix repeat-containing protein [Planctomycetota bacterium]
MNRLLTICVAAGLVMALSNSAQAVIWHVPGDFATIQEAIDSPLVDAGDTIMVGPGEHKGALVTKSVEIKGEEGAVINDGPPHPAGLSQGFRFLAGSDGAIISHLKFDNVDLAIMNGDAVDNVTVENCTFTNAIQAVSNWRGSGWQISHNTITDLRTRNGGGIGILIADFSGGLVADNVVSHNDISGTLHVWENDGGGYNGSGIVLYADFRWGRSGAEQIKDNRVVQNKVSLISDTPGVVDVAAFELTDTRDDPEPILGHVIFDNAIGFNDFRGTDTALQIVLTPAILEDYNEISRNKGDNRGRGSHPSLFGPGGS